MALETTNTSNKSKALDLAIQSIEKQFGRGSIMRLGTGGSLNEEMGVIPSGSPSLDLALGIGGIPKGRIIEVYGPESSGKTTLALHLVAECQKQGGTAAFVDAEHALDVNYARKLGVDVDSLLISQPDTGEQALEITDMLIKSSAVDILIVDSVAALVPRAELEGDMGDAQMGAQARLMSQALRKLTGSISKSKSTVLFINQVRMKIGVMFGNPETTTGGNALKFYASVRMDVRRIAAIKNGDDVIGNRTRVKVVKNKVSPPFKEVEFDIIYGKGICKEGDILDLATNLNIVQKSGTWYSYGDERLGQGREAVRDVLKERPKLVEELYAKVLKAKGIGANAKANETVATPAGKAEAKAVLAAHAKDKDAKDTKEKSSKKEAHAH
jgi:recombination protein RecA